MKLKFALGSVILLSLAFILNTAFLQSTLIDSYQISQITRFMIPIQSAVDAVEDALTNVDKRMTISEVRGTLERQREMIQKYWRKLNISEQYESDLLGNELLNMTIVLKSGSILVTTFNESKEMEIPGKLIDQLDYISTGKSLTEQEIIEDYDVYYVPLLLYDNRGRWIGSLIVHFDKEALRYAVAPMLDEHYIPSLFIGIFSILGILMLNLQSTKGDFETKKKTFTIELVALMMASLLWALLVNTSIYHRQFFEISLQNAHEVALKISSELHDQILQGTIKVATDIQRHGLVESVKLFDHFETVTITNPDGKSIYNYRTDRVLSSEFETAIKDVVIGDKSETQFLVAEKLAGIRLGGRPGGMVNIHVSRDEVFRNTVTLLINGVTILLITILVMAECLFLYMHFLNKKDIIKNRELRFEIGFVRPAMFLFLFGIDLSMSFVPLHMKSFDADLFGLSRDIVLGLPISTEFLFVGIFILIAGVWLDRRGWHEPFFIGLFIVGIGTLYSWWAPDAILFILARGLVGAGYGLTLMSAQGMIISFSEKNGRATGFSHLFAGLYSGSICGAAAGAILAERYGYEQVFFIGAIVVFLLIILAWIFMSTAVEQPGISYGSNRIQKPVQKIKLKPLLKFLSNPVFIAISLLSSLPTSIAVTGFLNFFTPVFLNDIGARESTIGQVLILYGICLVFFGPPIGKFIDRSKQKKNYMLAGGILGGLAFALFDADYGIAAMVLSIFLLGLSSSFILSSQSTIVLELDESQILGEGKAIGIFRSISRIGQVVGPIIFGWILLAGNLTEVINYFGYSYIFAIIILAIFINKPSVKLGHERAAV